MTSAEHVNAPGLSGPPDDEREVDWWEMESLLKHATQAQRDQFFQAFERRDYIGARGIMIDIAEESDRRHSERDE